MAVEPMIRVENFSYSYPGRREKVIDNLSFTVEMGEFLAITGLNDGGKTTLCRALTGVIPHSLGGRVWGSLTVHGLPVFDSSVAELVRHAGLVLDDPDSQLFTQTVDDEICFGMENLGRSVQEMEETLSWAKKVVGIGRLGERNPVELSGGQKQRVVLAAALALHPKILVLDEPCSQLDPRGSEEIFILLKRLREEQGMTIVLVSHNSPLISRYADRVLILHQGKTVWEGFPGDLFSRPELLEKFTLENPDPIPFETEALPSSQDVPLIEIDSLSHTYPSGVEALKNISLKVQEGDYLAVIGPNGSGKSTLLKCFLNLLKPFEGNIYIKGQPAADYHLADLAPLLGYMQQNPDRQLFSSTLWEETAFGPRNLGVKGEELEKRVEETLKTLDLADQKTEYPPALSRAGRSRAVLASVLAMNTPVLILDEPAGSQDNEGKRMILELTRRLNSQGFTIILVTHNMAHVREYARRVVVLDEGTIQENSQIKGR